MGGKGSGGLRVGAGRKSKDDASKWLGGNAGKRRPMGARPKVAAPFELVPPPADLPEAYAVVWNAEAPHACAARTLTPGTAAEFADFCKAVVIERTLLAKIEADGWTYLDVTVDGSGQEHQTVKKHPLVSDHRQWMQRVEQKRLKFRLAPIGKELTPAEVPADPFDEFDGADEKGRIQ